MARPKKAQKAQVAPAIDTEIQKTVDFQAGWKQRLRDRIEQLGLSTRSASLKAGLSSTTIRNILETDRGTGVDTLHQIAAALDTTIHELTTGEAPVVVSGSQSDAGSDAIQWVPTIAWSDVVEFCRKTPSERTSDMGMAMRVEAAEAISPPGGRFRVECANTSMAGMMSPGDILDCSAEFAPEPDDVVIVWHNKTRSVVARKLSRVRYDESGEVREAGLVATSDAWPPLDFNAANGDIMLAVVFDIIRPLRRNVRRGRRPKLN